MVVGEHLGAVHHDSVALGVTDDGHRKGLASVKGHAAVPLLRAPLFLQQAVAHHLVVIEPWVEVQSNTRVEAQIDAEPVCILVDQTLDGDGFPRVKSSLDNCFVRHNIGLWRAVRRRCLIQSYMLLLLLILLLLLLLLWVMMSTAPSSILTPRLLKDRLLDKGGLLYEGSLWDTITLLYEGRLWDTGSSRVLESNGMDLYTPLHIDRIHKRDGETVQVLHEMSSVHNHRIGVTVDQEGEGEAGTSGQWHLGAPLL